VLRAKSMPPPPDPPGSPDREHAARVGVQTAASSVAKVAAGRQSMRTCGAPGSGGLGRGGAGRA
jgi:hypothetical protein